MVAPCAALGVVADQDGLASGEPLGDLVRAPELRGGLAPEAIGSAVDPVLAIGAPFRLGAAGGPGGCQTLGVTSVAG